LQDTLDLPAVLADNAEPGNDVNPSDFTPGNSPLASTTTFWEAIKQSTTTQVILPQVASRRRRDDDNVSPAFEEGDLEVAAGRFLAGLTSEQWVQFDQALQDRVLTPLGGLGPVCIQSGDLLKGLLSPLVQQASQYLGEHLPVTDVAQVLFGEAQFLTTNPRASQAAIQPVDPAEIQKQIRSYYDRAVPLIGERRKGKGDQPIPLSPEMRPRSYSSLPSQAAIAVPDEHLFLLIPSSEAGKTYGELAQQTLPALQPVPVAGQSALVFCREHGFVRVEELQRVLVSCRRSYEESAVLPQSSPHSRCDILDWMPLDP
jgi:hypothetical protein